MKFSSSSAFHCCCFAAFLVAALAPAVQGQTPRWNNTGTNWNSAASWSSPGKIPDAGDTADFNVPRVNNPNLSASSTIAALIFSSTTSSGYTITGSSLAITNPTAITASNTSGVNQINTPLALANFGTPVISQAAGGTLTLGGSLSIPNTTQFQFTGPGTIRLGASNVLPDNKNIILNGGTLATVGGNTDTTGTLRLLSSSTISNGSGLSFAASSATSWGSSLLTIVNWTSGSIRFGTTSIGLSSLQLSRITAYYGPGVTNPAGPLQLDTNGFLIVAIPEPGAVMAGMVLLGGIGWRERRHFIRRRTVA